MIINFRSFPQKSIRKNVQISGKTPFHDNFPHFWPN